MRFFARARAILLSSVSTLAVSHEVAFAQAAAPPAGEEIVVTGSRVQATGYTAPTPVTVLGSAAIQQRAPASIAEVLYELPSIRNNGPTQANRGSSTGGTNVISLRNLGDTRTLVLLDGRRFTPSINTTSWDTNLVPTGLVDRIEVVTGGASAAYGSDAVAGVVNFILKDRVEGLQGQIHYGISQEGDNIERAADLSGGHTFMDDKLSVVFSASYSKNKGVGLNEGFYARDWGQREYGILTGVSQAGLAANLVSNNVEFSNRTPGGLITAGPGANVTQFNAQGQPVPFARGFVAGTQMIGTANYGNTLTGLQALRTPSERQSFFTRATYDVTPNLAVFAEFVYGEGEGNGRTGSTNFGAGEPGGNGAIVIRSDNPFLPAATRALMAPGSTIDVSRLSSEIGGIRSTIENTTRRAVIGARGTVFEDWNWDISYESGKNDYNRTIPNIADIANFRAAVHAVAGPNGTVVCGPLATNPGNAASRALAAQAEPGCQPYNPFGAGAPSAAALDYTTATLSESVNSRQDSFAANMSGSPFATWAGPVNVAYGYEWRKYEVDSGVDSRSQANLLWFANPKPILGEIEVNEGYGEIVVPLAADMAFAKTLDLNAAVRRTNYSTSGDVTTWKVGFTYEPIDLLRLRATQSRDIRAPNILELFNQGGGGVGQIGGGLTAATVTVGNLLLEPEEADTFTAGFVVGPFAGARLGVDFFNITIKDVIATLSPAEIVSRCNISGDQSACALLTRSGAAITAVRVQPQNLNKQKTNGFDIEASYRVPMEALNLPGQIDLRLLATRTMRLETFDALGVSLGNLAGGGLGQPTQGIPKWRGTFNLGYQLDKFDTNLQVLAFSELRYNVRFIGPEDPRYAAAIATTTNPLYASTINKNKFPGHGYVNWSAQYTLIDEEKRNLRAFVNVDNVFDKDPPFGWNQDLATYDTIGRTYKVGLRFDY